MRRVITALVFALSEYHERVRIDGHSDPVSSAAFQFGWKALSPRQKTRRPKFGMPETGSISERLPRLQRLVLSAAFDLDGARVITASEDKIARIWDARTGKLLVELKRHGGEVYSGAISPDGTRAVTASEDKTVQIWNTGTGEPLTTLEHGGKSGRLEFDRDGARVVTASEDKKARIWDAKTGKLLVELKGHQEKFTPQHSVRTAHASSPPRRTGPLASGTPRQAVPSASLPPKGRCQCCGLQPRWRASVVTASFDNTARIWDVATQTVLVEFRGHDEVVNSAAFQRMARTSSRLQTTTLARIRHRRGPRHVLPRRFCLHRRIQPRWCAHRHGLSRRDRPRLECQNRDTPRYTQRPSRRSGLRQVRPSWGVPVAAASEDKTALVWNAQTGKVLASLSTIQVLSAAFARDGLRIVTASEDNFARIWDAKTGEVLRELRHPDHVNFAEFSKPDGASIVTACSDKSPHLERQDRRAHRRAKWA